MDIITNISDLRVTFTTNVNEIKIDSKLQNHIIKSQLTREQIEKMLIKLIKYKGNRQIEIFIQNFLFKDKQQSLLDFLKSNSLLNEKLSETGIDIFYCFQMEEPELIDSKKQDEWIKKIISFNKDTFAVGLFNSEFTFYDVKSMEKLNTIKVKDEEIADFLFLNDFCFALNNNNGNSLLISAIRENGLLFEIQEVNKANNKISISPSVLQSQPTDYNINKLASSPYDNRLVAAGCSNGSLQLYRFDNQYVFNSSTNEDKPIKKKSKGNIKQIISPINQVTLQNQSFNYIEWMNEMSILGSNIDAIRLFNVATFSLVSSINTNTHLSTCLLSLSNGLILSSFDNGSVKIFDHKASNSLVNQIKSHRGYVSSITKYDKDENKFFSTGYDGMIKLWDLRNTAQCYYKLPSNYKDKVFTSCFLDNTLATGGESSYIEYFQI